MIGDVNFITKFEIDWENDLIFQNCPNMNSRKAHNKDKCPVENVRFILANVISVKYSLISQSGKQLHGRKFPTFRLAANNVWFNPGIALK